MAHNLACFLVGINDFNGGFKGAQGPVDMNGVRHYISQTKHGKEKWEKIKNEEGKKVSEGLILQKYVNSFLFVLWVIALLILSMWIVDGSIVNHLWSIYSVV